MDQFYKDAKKVMFSGDPSDLRYYIEELKILHRKYSALIAQGELEEQEIFLQTLQGKARAWFLDYQRAWRSWNDCLDDLRESFGLSRDILKAQLRTLSFKIGDNVQEFCERYLSLTEELGYETTGQRALEDFIGKIKDRDLRLDLASQAKSNSLFEATRLLKRLVSLSMGTDDSGDTADVQAAPESTPVSKYGSSAPPTTSAAPAKADVHSDVDVLAKKFDQLVLTMQESQRAMQENQRQLINALRGRHDGPPPWQRNRDGQGPTQQPTSSNQHTQSNNNSGSQGHVRLIRSTPEIERELCRPDGYPSIMPVHKFDYYPEEEPVSPKAQQTAGGLSMAAVSQPTGGPSGSEKRVTFAEFSTHEGSSSSTSVMQARRPPAVQPAAGDGDAAMLPRPAPPPSGAQVAEVITNRYLFGTRLNITFGELYKVAAPRYRAMMTNGFNLLHQETEREQQGNAGPALKVGGRVALAQSHPGIFECDNTNSVGTVPADAHGLLEVEATIAGHPGNVMVDTGSTYNVIEEKWARSLGIMSSLGSPKVYSGVDGVKHYSLGTCTLTVTLGKGIHRIQCPSEFIVIPDNTSPKAPFMVLVGLPFLRALRATVDVAERRLHVMRDGRTRCTFDFLPDTASDSVVAAIRASPPAVNLPPTSGIIDIIASIKPAACSKVVECINNSMDSVQLPSWFSKDRAIAALSRFKNATSSVKEQLTATPQHLQLASVCTDIKEKIADSLHAGAGLFKAFGLRIVDSISNASKPAAVGLKEFSFRGNTVSVSTVAQPVPAIVPMRTLSASEPAAAPLGGTSSDRIASSISVAWLPMSAEPPDASDGIPKLSGCEDRDCSAGLGFPGTGSSSLSKTDDTATAPSAYAFEQALRDNPFVFAMQQESLRDAVRRVLSIYSVSGPPFPGQYEPPLTDEEMELVKEMMAMTSKQPIMEACALGAPTHWSQGDATAVG
jgi:hypothetical protein